MNINEAIDLMDNTLNFVTAIADVLELYGEKKIAEEYRKSAAKYDELAEWLKGFKEYLGVNE